LKSLLLCFPPHFLSFRSLDNTIWVRLTTLLTELYALVLKALAIGYCILSGLDIEWFYSILYQRVKQRFYPESETPNLISGDFTALKSGLSSSGTCANVLWGACSFTQSHGSVRRAFV
jgi:hypothetical protein